MRAFAAAFLAVAFAVAPISSSAAPDKTLQNTKGTNVAYQLQGQSAATTVAPRAVASLLGQATAIVGATSQAAIVLSDSSIILIGENTTLQVQQFDNLPSGATAAFAMTNQGGKVRFAVNHPAGAKANYTFSTPTGQIAVRGTEGDFFSNGVDQLQVNCYELDDPALPVHVTLPPPDGRQFDLSAGQSLTAQLIHGTWSVQQSAVTQALAEVFVEFGTDAAIAKLGLTLPPGVVVATQSHSGGTNAAYSLLAIPAVILLSGHGTSSPATQPTPSGTTTAPITIISKTRRPTAATGSATPPPRT